MNKTKIEWADYTWNVVTGCKHGCPYCYAERITDRFGGASETHCNETVGTECQWATESTGEIHDLAEPIYDVDRGRNALYPFYFDPTFHRYRLDEPQKIKKPQKVFVVSMGDLFGEWVPGEWINEVREACERASWHTYLFLTKNPARYAREIYRSRLDYRNNFWFGATVTDSKSFDIVAHELWSNTGRDAERRANRFLSIEPLIGRIDNGLLSHVRDFDWVIIGGQTGPGAVKPKAEWVNSIIEKCREAGVPLFLKDNLGWTEKVQEFPLEVTP